MKVTVCIGSYCHLKGSKQVVDILRNKIRENHLEERVELAGTFCMGNCKDDVSVTVDGNLFSVSPETAEQFFADQIAAKL